MYHVEIKTYPDNGAGWVTAHSPFLDDSRCLCDGKLTLVHAGISDFEFSLLYGHPLFDIVTPMKSRVRILDVETADEIFVGRVIDVTNKMDGSGMILRNFIAEDDLGLLCDTVQRHKTFVDNDPEAYLKEILKKHNEQVEGSVPDKNFKFYGTSVTGKVGTAQWRCLTYQNTYESIMENLVEPLGGRLSLRQASTDNLRILDYEPYTTVNGGIPIELAKNLQSIEEKQRPARLITRLVPLGATYETVEDAIMTLINAGLINKYNNVLWLQKVTTNIKIEWLGQLLLNLSKLSYSSRAVNNIGGDVTRAIDFLSNAGAINTPGYWLTNHSKESGVADLLILAAEQCNTDTDKGGTSKAVKRRYTISPVVGRDYMDSDLISRFGIIEGEMIWDNVTDPNELYELGHNYLAQQFQTLRTCVTLSAVELRDAGGKLNRFEVGKKYTVEHTPLSIQKQEYQVVSKVIDLLDETKSSLTFGEADVRITSTR